MAAKLMSLRDVTDDEAEEVRALLEQHRFDYYETPPGFLGISAATLWLYDNDDLKIAKGLLEQYQQERGQRVRTEYEQLCARGEQRSFLDEIRAYPVRVIAFLALAIAIAYFSVAPFIEIGQ